MFLCRLSLKNDKSSGSVARDLDSGYSHFCEENLSCIVNAVNLLFLT